MSIYQTAVRNDLDADGKIQRDDEGKILTREFQFLTPHAETLLGEVLSAGGGVGKVWLKAPVRFGLNAAEITQLVLYLRNRGLAKAR